MERDSEPEAEAGQGEEHNLKQEREAITPGEETWSKDDSDDSMASDEQEQQQVISNEKEVVAPSSSRERSDTKMVSVDHSVDYNYLLLLNVLNRRRIINIRAISMLKEGEVIIKTNQRKMVVRAVTNEEANKAIETISDYLDKLSIVKLGIRGFAAAHMMSFKSLRQDLLDSKIVILPMQGSTQEAQLQLGGEMRPSQLRAHAQKLNNMRIKTFFLRAYRNKRSYCVILSEILNTDYMREAFKQFCLVSHAEVARDNQNKELRVAVGSMSNKDITPNEYQDFMMKHISKFYVLIFCFESKERYLEKLKCEKASFRFLTEKKFNRSYLFVTSLKEDFRARSQEIAEQVAKIGDKIMGVRLFYKIDPNIKALQFQREKHYFFQFPEERPYSTVVTARRGSGYVFDWRDYMRRVLQLR